MKTKEDILNLLEKVVKLKEYCWTTNDPKKYAKIIEHIHLMEKNIPISLTYDFEESLDKIYEDLLSGYKTLKNKLGL